MNKPIPEMLEMLNEPNKAACLKLYNECVEIFKTAQGSSHNHQAWKGGYHDHIQEVMNLACMLYPVYSIRQLNFSLQDALLVLFVHDLEKPWREEVLNIADKENVPLKLAKIFMRKKRINEYMISLNAQQYNSFTYVEGENKDYSSKERVMNELAAFCHICDVSSARIWHDYPKK